MILDNSDNFKSNDTVPTTDEPINVEVTMEYHPEDQDENSSPMFEIIPLISLIIIFTFLKRRKKKGEGQ